MSDDSPTVARPAVFEVRAGDCTEVLPSLPDACFDAVVVDPPYGINTKSAGAGKLHPWADLVNAASFYAQWISECRRVLKPTGSLWTCSSWRTLVTMQRTAALLSWPIESLLVWDKCWIGPGGSRGLRPSYEVVCLWTMPEFSVADRGVADVQRFKWAGRKQHHPAEKPVDLMRFLVRHGSPEGGVILDPFAGSGTTGVACVHEGRSFLGIEQDEHYADVARGRIAEARLGAPSS